MSSGHCGELDADYTLHLPLIIIYAVGILGNFTIKLVLLWKGEKSVVNKLLIMLAVWDNLFLVCRLGEVVSVWGQKDVTMIKDPAFVWIFVGCQVYSDRGHPGGFCQQLDDWEGPDWSGMNFPTTTSYTWYTLSSIFQLASVYHTVIIAVFRFIAILAPFKVSTLCTGHRAIFACVISFIICICVHVPGIILIPVLQKWWLCIYYYDTISWDSYLTCISPLSDSLFYKYLHWFIILQRLLYHILPCLDILVSAIYSSTHTKHHNGLQTVSKEKEQENKSSDQGSSCLGNCVLGNIHSKTLVYNRYILLQRPYY